MRIVLFPAIHHPYRPTLMLTFFPAPLPPLHFPSSSSLPHHLTVIYTLITPLGITLGTIIRQSYDSSSPSTVLAIGTLNSMSAGVLLYGAIVDLLAKEFLFAKDSGGHGHGHGGGGGGGCAGEEGEVEVAKGMLDASWSRVASALGAVYMGAALMSLLGKWA